MDNSLAREAARCRSEAIRFAGKPEEPFLLKISAAFDELAQRDASPHARSSKSLA